MKELFILVVVIIIIFACLPSSKKKKQERKNTKPKIYPASRAGSANPQRQYAVRSYIYTDYSDRKTKLNDAEMLELKIAILNHAKERMDRYPKPESIDEQFLIDSVGSNQNVHPNVVKRVVSSMTSASIRHLDNIFRFDTIRTDVFNSIHISVNESMLRKELEELESQRR